MVDVPMALGSLKIALDIAKGMKDLNDTSVRSIESIKLMEQIISAQLAQAALIQQVRDLETEVAAFKSWDAEKQRYALTDFGGGTFAYALKPDKANGEPPHKVCANCYQQGKISILQYSGKFSGQERFDCHLCDKPSYLGTKVRDEPISRGHGGF